MNLKFPKEETLVISKIRTLIFKKDYIGLLNAKEELLNNAKFINTYSSPIINEYIKIIFEIRKFDDVVNIIEELNKQGIEDCMWYYYAILSLLANKDFLYIKRLIKKSNILNDASIKCLLDIEESSYSNIINLHPTLFETFGPCLLIIYFSYELISEMLNSNINDDYMIMRFFDLLNLLYENGVDEKIILLFQKNIEIIYQIQMC